MKQTQDDIALLEICNLYPDWKKKYEQPDRLNYFLIAEIGRELLNDLIENKSSVRIKKVFEKIEDLLTNATFEVSSLIGAGMFESMQNDAYERLNPPDLLNQFMGPIALSHWEDIIEGWTGTGIRSIADWKRVLLNGSSLSLIIKFFNPVKEIRFDGKESKDQLDVPPIMAERHIAWVEQIRITQAMGFDKPYAQISTIHKDEVILVGNYFDKSKTLRYVKNEDQIATIPVCFLEEIKNKK